MNGHDYDLLNSELDGNEFNESSYFQTLKVDISLTPKISRYERTLNYVRNLVLFVHGHEVRENGSPYIEGHLEEVEDFVAHFLKRNYTKGRIIALAHDLPEDSISQLVGKSPLRIFYELFDEKPTEFVKRFVIPVGLMTKLSNRRVEKHFPEEYIGDEKLRYFIKPFRITSDYRRDLGYGKVLGFEPSIEDRIFARLTYIGDMKSNSNLREKFSQEIAMIQYSKYANLPHYTDSDLDLTQKVSLNDFLKLKEEHFYDRKIRNQVRNIVIIPMLIDFFNRYQKEARDILNLAQLEQTCGSILDSSSKFLDEINYDFNSIDFNIMKKLERDLL